MVSAVEEPATDARPKVLLSCYACEPDRGSEPSVGWNWTRAMCQQNDLVVVTRANNREVIESGLAALGGNQVEFVYYDLPQWLLWLKRRGILKASLYYVLWQFGVRSKLSARIEDFDIVHHMTFNMFLCPGFWRPKKAKLILGPLGGGSCVAQSYLPLFGRKAWVQRWRKKLVANWKWMPLLKRTMDRADVILCANEDTYSLLGKTYPAKCQLHLETGIEIAPSRDAKEGSAGDKTIVQIGGIEPRKGWKLSLMAVDELLNRRSVGGFRFLFVGSGPEIADARKMSDELGLADVVIFCGKKTLAETQSILTTARALVFPSVRDTSGNVVLEAMANGVPVVCINHQGAKEMSDDQCAIRLEPDTIEKTASDLADAIERLLGDDELCASMGKAGRQRIAERHAWAAKRAFMQDVYGSVLRR